MNHTKIFVVVILYQISKMSWELKIDGGGLSAERVHSNKSEKYQQTFLIHLNDQIFIYIYNCFIKS